MSNVLVIEDEARIASFVAKGLEAAGHAVSVAADGDEGLEYALTGAFDLVLLDLGLPGRDGFAVLEHLRIHDASMPVIVLTAREDLEATVRSFDLGADDYVTKPFRVAELLARVAARLRGAEQRGTDVLVGAGWELDLRQRVARRGDETVELTQREFALARELFQSPSRVLSRTELANSVWGYDHDPDSNIVDVYVGYLRRKLGGEVVTTVRGMGYRLGPPPQG
jgi:DNA-binding response OmpR family regulator